MDSYSQVLFKANRVHNMPAVHTKPLLAAIEAIWFDDLRQPEKWCGERAVCTRWLLEIPGTPEVIFRPGATDRGKISVTIQIHFDLAFAPPAGAVDLPGDIRADVMTFAFYIIQEGMCLFIAQRISAPPLRVKIRDILRHISERIIDLVVEHGFLCSQIFNGQTRVLAERHFPV